MPSEIIAAQDFPRTLNGKVAEIAVKKLIHGDRIDNADAIANPESLSFFEMTDLN